MKLNQLVYTSASTTKGKGYQTIGASCGISPAERAAIEWHVHLKQAMPESVDFAGSLSYFLLDKDAPRVCIARTFPAGSDHFGRPGRVLTHALVLERSDFATFHNDPFLFDALASREEVYSPSDEVPSEMPVRDVDVDEVAVPPLARMRGRTRGAETLGAVLSTVYAEQGCAIVGEEFPLDALALAFRFIPQPVRLDLTFATVQLSPKDKAFRVIGVPPSVADDGSLKQSRRICLSLDGERSPDGARMAPYVSLVLELLEKADDKGLALLLGRASDLGLIRKIGDLGTLADVLLTERDISSKPSVAGLLRLSSLLEGADADRRDEIILSRFETTLDAMLRESDWGNLAELMRRVATIEMETAEAKGEIRATRAVVEGAGTLIELATYERFCAFMAVLRQTDAEVGTRFASASIMRHGEALLDGVSARLEPDASDIGCLEMVLAEEVRGRARLRLLVGRLTRLAISACARDEGIRAVLLHSARACEGVVAPGTVGEEERREALNGLLAVYGELGDENGQLRLYATLLVERHAAGVPLVSGSRCGDFIEWASQGDRTDFRVRRLAALLKERDKGLALEALAKCLTLKEIKPSGAAWAAFLAEFRCLAAGSRDGRARHYWSQLMDRFSEAPHDLRMRVIGGYISSLGAWDRLKLRWRAVLPAFLLGLVVGLSCRLLMPTGLSGKRQAPQKATSSRGVTREARPGSPRADLSDRGAGADEASQPHADASDLGQETTEDETPGAGTQEGPEP